MKKIILSLVTIIMMGVSAFASGKEGIVSQQAQNAFKRDFVTASNVSWEQKDNFVKATFSFNGQILNAYYNTNGDLQAVVRNILSDQLPINLLTDLRRDYTGYWITDLFEMSSGDQTTYYVTLENSEKKLVLKSEDASYWDVYSKTRKDQAE
jgi:hypothetical protein